MSIEYEKIKNEIEKELKIEGIYYDESMIKKSIIYINEILLAQKKMNLVSDRSSKDIINIHFIDSIIIKKFKDICDIKILDIGTGAGFPGIPLAIFSPQCDFTLLDSNRKKINFLKYVSYKAMLENVYIINVRAEELAKGNTHKGMYNVITGRAVSSVNNFLELSFPFLNEEGEVLLYKTPDYYREEDYNELNDKKFYLKEEFGYKLANGERRLILTYALS